MDKKDMVRPGGEPTAASSASRGRPADRWRTIDSAPRCVDGANEHTNGRRPVLVTRHPVNGHHHPIAVARLTGRGWISGKRSTKLWFAPTHWLPLPDGPQAQDEAEDAATGGGPKWSQDFRERFPDYGTPCSREEALQALDDLLSQASVVAGYDVPEFDLALAQSVINLRFGLRSGLLEAPAEGDKSREEPNLSPETSALLAEAEEAIAAGAMLHTWPWPKITGLIGELAQALRETQP